MRNGFLHPQVVLLLVILTLSLGGCVISTMPRPEDNTKTFSFAHDTLSFANELDWVYRPDPESGKLNFTKVDPEPDYIHHCFVVVRTAKQFFLHARFDATAPKADEKTYRELIHTVLEHSPRDLKPNPQRIVIPGYADLRSFSTAWPDLIKDEAGGSWQSYVQLGNWRMILPFPRGWQQETAERLLAEIHANWPPIIHVVTFPIITINHAVLLYDAHETDQSIKFSVYDPNHPEAAGELIYDRASRTFIFPATNYFEDGPVNVYEVYHGIYF